MHVPAVPPSLPAASWQKAGGRQSGPFAVSHGEPLAAGATHVPINVCWFTFPQMPLPEQTVRFPDFAS
jgi:hypothetical protein